MPRDIVVDIADMKVTDDPDAVLVTYALGSCIGVTIWDSVARVGGMLHYMLPESTLDPTKAARNPYMFGDSGIPLLFRSAYALGAVKSRLRVKVAGGAERLGPMDGTGFAIGKRNYLLLRKLFWKNNVLIDGEEVGGNVPRTLRLVVGNGRVLVGTGSNEREL